MVLASNKAIDNFQNETAGIREEERHLQRIILRLFIKLTLIAPAKRGVITSIKKSDITKDYKILLINGIDVNMQVATGMRKKERTASKKMCDFFILNISSLQLIPVNMIVYRQQYGSVNPTAVIAPAIVATFFSTLVAVVFCKVKDGRRRK